MKYRIIKEVNNTNKLERFRVQFKGLFFWYDDYINSYGNLKAVFYSIGEAEEFIRDENSKKEWKFKEILK
jgi:hypothetical protein